MTHDGPATSCTTIDKTTRMNEGIIYFGSNYLYSLLQSNQGRVICNIHGHAHDGAVMDKIDNLKIINPGGLRFGEFAEMTMKENADGTWRIEGVNKHYLS